MFSRRRSRLAEVVRSTAVVHTKSGRSIAGILMAEYDDVLALTRVRLLGAGDAPTLAIDGEILVPRSEVDFVQLGVTIDDTRSLGR